MCSADNEDWFAYIAGIKRTSPKAQKKSLKTPAPHSRSVPLRVSEKVREQAEGLPFLLPPSTKTAFPFTEIEKEKNIKFSKRQERDLRRGHLDVDGKIDLHGLTQREAQLRLTKFVLMHAAQGAKRLLVVTGKGREGQSVLRANLPIWCKTEALSPCILTLRPAAVPHGGEGAFYLILKKLKDRHV